MVVMLEEYVRIEANEIIRISNNSVAALRLVS